MGLPLRAVAFHVFPQIRSGLLFPLGLQNRSVDYATYLITENRQGLGYDHRTVAKAVACCQAGRWAACPEPCRTTWWTMVFVLVSGLAKHRTRNLN